MSKKNLDAFLICVLMLDIGFLDLTVYSYSQSKMHFVFAIIFFILFIINAVHAFIDREK